MTHCMRHQHHIGPGCQGTFRLALAGLNLALLLVGASTASAQTASAPPSASASASSADETPRVLYVVPWKQPLPGVPTGRPLNSVLDEAPGSIDRAIFLRQINYSQQLQRAAGGLPSSTMPPAPAAPSPSTARSNTPPASTPATR